uniref:Uncharacterized protein n=1 Tax=Geospiza parvula TaxID=87175 RepID=A0A8U8ANP7_GEOPR
ERCAYSAPLRASTDTSACIFKIQCLLECDHSSLSIHHELLKRFSRHFSEAVGDAGIGAGVGIRGKDVQHRRSRRCVLAQADAVPVLREHGWVVIGVGDVNPELGGASPGRVSAIQSRQNQA